MTSVSLCERLHQQSEKLPNKLPTEVTEPTTAVAAQWQQSVSYIDWQEAEWQEFALAQFMRDDDEVEYFFSDAQGVFHS